MVRVGADRRRDDVLCCHPVEVWRVRLSFTYRLEMRNIFGCELHLGPVVADVEIDVLPVIADTRFSQLDRQRDDPPAATALPISDEADAAELALTRPFVAIPDKRL